MDPRLNRLYPWLEKAKTNKTMSKKLLKALARVKLISMRQDKVIINSWDITYQENLRKYEKKTARFVEEDLDGAEASGEYGVRMGSDLQVGMRRLKRGYDNKKASGKISDASLAANGGGAGNGLNLSPSQARRFHPIVIEEIKPIMAIPREKNDGSVLVTAPYIKT